MPALTKARHEAFARAIVAQLGGKYTSQGAAYVAAGFTAKGVGESGGSAEVCAARLLKRVQPIAERVAELQAIAAKRKKVTVETIVDELEEARDIAKEQGQSAAMVAASTGKAKILGLVVDRTEQGKPGDFSQAQDSQAIARSLLKQAGMNESELTGQNGDVACQEALEALDHFQKRIAAIVTGTQAIAS